MALAEKFADLRAWKETKLGTEKLVTTRRGLRALAYAKRVLYRDGRVIVINSMPKSGSTFLSNALARVLEYEHGYAASSYSNIEQELDLPKLIDLYGRGVVIQQHFRANSSNIRLLSEFGMRPVVLTRNLFDTVVSLRDHLLSEGLENIHGGFPGLYPSHQYAQLGSKMQLDFLIEFAVPWFLSYYASWCSAARRGEIDLQWVHYEAASADWTGAIRNVLDFYGLTASSELIEDVVASLSMRRGSETRLNVGVTGRGSIQLSSLQQTRIAEMTRFYPDVDFTPIGVPRPVEPVGK